MLNYFQVDIEFNKSCLFGWCGSLHLNPDFFHGVLCYLVYRFTGLVGHWIWHFGRRRLHCPFLCEQCRSCQASKELPFNKISKVSIDSRSQHFTTSRVEISLSLLCMNYKFPCPFSIKFSSAFHKMDAHRLTLLRHSFPQKISGKIWLLKQIG